MTSCNSTGAVENSTAAGGRHYQHGAGIEFVCGLIEQEDVTIANENVERNIWTMPEARKLE